VLKVRLKAGELQKQYPQDLVVSFMNECIHFRGYLKAYQKAYPQIGAIICVDS